VIIYYYGILSYVIGDLLILIPVHYYIYIKIFVRVCVSFSLFCVADTHDVLIAHLYQLVTVCFFAVT
jgi:hypothetical protein